jgi:hypothetical protein
MHADVDMLALKARQRIEKICAPGSRASKLNALAEALIRSGRKSLQGHHL